MVGAGITCTGSLSLTSNVVAWRSAEAISSSTTCPIRNSLFDVDAGQITGVGNNNVPIGEIFVDLATGALITERDERGAPYRRGWAWRDRRHPRIATPPACWNAA